MSEHTEDEPIEDPRDAAPSVPADEPPEGEMGAGSMEAAPFGAPPGAVPEEPSFAMPQPAVPSVPPRRRPAAYVAVALGLIGMVGGAVFFARSLGKTEGGGSTPVASVQKFFDALGDQDALGVLETLLPSERDLFRTSIQDIARELGRLGILRKDLNLNALNGIELDFTDIKLSTQTIAPGFNTVSVVSGRVRYSVNPTGPLGDFVNSLLPAEAKKVTQGSQDLTPEDFTFTTVKEGDNWYVSLWYSIAEGARKDAAAPVPQFGAGLVAKGAATPEQAIEQFLRAGVGLDVRRLVELLPPVEMRALHDYAPLFLPAAEAGVREAGKAFRAQIRTLKTSARTTGERAVVKIDEFTFAFEIPALGVAVDYDGTCVTLRGEMFGAGTPQRQCGGAGGSIPGFGLPNIGTPDVGFVAVREGGLWYVSPLGSVFDAILNTLKVLDRGDLDAIKALVSAFGFSGDFTTPGIPIPTPTS